MQCWGSEPLNHESSCQIWYSGGHRNQRRKSYVGHGSCHHHLHGRRKGKSENLRRPKPLDRTFKDFNHQLGRKKLDGLNVGENKREYVFGAEALRRPSCWSMSPPRPACLRSGGRCLRCKKRWRHRKPNLPGKHKFDPCLSASPAQLHVATACGIQYFDDERCLL